jgi:hypothetical protein
VIIFGGTNNEKLKNLNSSTPLIQTTTLCLKK